MRGIVMRTLFLFLALSAAGMFSAAGAGAAEVVVGVSKTPAAIPVLRMLESGVPEGITIKLVVWVGPEQLIAMAQDGRHQLFTLPLTVAAKLHSRGVGIRITNVNTWGGIRLVTSDKSLTEWRDLAGKTVYVPQRSSPPDALTRFFLDRAGLAAGKDVEFVYAPVAEISQLIMSGRIDHAVLIEPRATAAVIGNPSLRAVFDYEEEWRRAFGGDARLPSLGFGGTTAFVDANHELVARLEKEYAAAVEWVVSHPAEAGELAAKHLGLDAETVWKAVPHFGLSYVPAAQAAPEVESFFRVLNDFSPGLIGDDIPDATLYWR